jgi:hypothetical protein
MSTVCGVGVGMFGALLVVVALKVRLFQSRRLSQQGSNPHASQGTTTQQQQQQQHQQAHSTRDHGHKKVLSRSALDEFGIQTVIKTGDGTMLVAAARSTTTTKCCSHHCRHQGKSHLKKKKVAKMVESIPEMTQLPRRTEIGYGGRLAYVENVIDMEAVGLGNSETRRDARRQLEIQRQRRVRNTSAQVLSVENQLNDDGDGDEQEEESQFDDNVEHQSDRHDLQEYREEDEGEQDADTATPAVLDRVATSFNAISRHGSYRRVSYSRQGFSSETYSSSSLSSSTSTLLHSASSWTNGSMSTLDDTSYSEASSSSLSLSISLSLSTDRRGDKPFGGVPTNNDNNSHECEDDNSIDDSGVEDMSDLEDSDDEDDEIAQGKNLPFANANAQTMCAVCLAEFELGDQVRTLPCFHQYHPDCIDPWLLQVAALCPICKRDLLQPTTIDA